jgi:hypothetical protein
MKTKRTKPAVPIFDGELFLAETAIMFDFSALVDAHERHDATEFARLQTSFADRHGWRIEPVEPQ